MMPFSELFSQPQLAPFLVGCGVGAVVCGLVFLIGQQRQQRRQWALSLRLERAQEQSRSHGEEAARLRAERNQMVRECRVLEAHNASLQTTCSALEERIRERTALLAETRRQIEQDFNVLAGRIITEKGEQLAGQHASALTLLLRPLHEQLTEFKHKVEEVYDREARDRVSMGKEIEQLKQLNSRLGAEAANLAEALRGSNKLQGQWGEMVLARVLEASGLRRGSEFALQVGLKTEDGASLQPDALVYLPESRTIVIDAKVSLKAFAEAHSARDEAVRRQQIALHLESVKRQINLLARKRYHQLTGAGSLDFVLLFIPVEAAFLLAVNEDPELLVSAMQQNVILTCPSTLLAILRTVHHLWRMEEQNRNSLVIAKQAGNLYDKFVGFTEAFEEIGLRLNQTHQAWHTARNRLSAGQGNLIAKAETLKTLGVQASKQLPDSLKNSSAEGHLP